ncbi:MAG: peptidoglycan editing factor PgeF [Pseudomonadota bacterium]
MTIPHPPFLQDEHLAQHPGVTHGWFGREGGVSTGIFEGLNAGLGSGDDQEAVVENRSRIAAALGVEAHKLISPYQVHSADVVTVDAPFPGERPKADGIVTATEGLAIGIVTADCGPVLFSDPNMRVIGACHAGWKGALTGVMEATIDAMEKMGSKRSKIRAVLGPTIGRENYEVGPEFPKPFLEDDETNTRFFRPSARDGHHMFDLPAYIVTRLKNAGVDGAHIGPCTYEDEAGFYSYRRTTHRGEGDYGRQLSAIALHGV